VGAARRGEKKGRKAKKSHGPCTYSRPRVYAVQGAEWTVLICVPRWGSSYPLASVPSGWGISDLNGFIEAGLVPEDFMRKPEAEPDRVRRWAAGIDDILEKYPLLAEHLAATHYDGEEPGTRQTGSLLIFAQDGWWKAMLRDKATQRCLWTTCPDFLGILGMVEEHIGCPSPDWRLDRASGAPQASRESKKKLS